MSETIRIADLVFVRGTHFFDRAIEEITQSPYSHVAGVVKANELIEAAAISNVAYQALDFYRNSGDVFTCDRLTDEMRQRIAEIVTKELGEPYDYFLIAWELPHYLFHLNLPFQEGVRRDCSTLFADAYKAVGVDLCPGLSLPSPGELAMSTELRFVGKLSELSPQIP